MNFKLAVSSLVLGFSVFACSVESTDPADAEESDSTESDMIANAQKLAGSFTLVPGIGAPTMQGIVFNANGTFFADVDTGIRCFRAPCPSNVRMSGTFTATKSYVRLSPKAGEAATEYHGRYKYTLANDALSISRKLSGNDWSQSLTKAGSYCAAPVDCEGQSIIHPMCVGHWTCGGGEANACGYACGVPVPASVIPADATSIVASSPGGGFVPPSPAGSACNIGMRKYTYDVASKTVSFEECDTSGATFVVARGSKVLTASKAKKVKAALDGLAVSEGDICGADKPWLTLDVAAPSGNTKLVDEFYSCRGGNNTYVSGIDAVFTALHDASH